MKKEVTIYEVGPRDGLQNEKMLIATEDKIELVNNLTACGFKKIEVTSFVSPKWVPQMADASRVLEGIIRLDKVTYSALTPNLRGFHRAQTACANEVSIFAAASEGFSMANINCSIEDSLKRFKLVVNAAKAADISIRGFVSVVTDCPYDGRIDPSAVTRVAKALADMGCHEVGLADTIGAATPETVAHLIDAVLEVLPAAQLSCHFHDTNGLALENVDVALEKGIRRFDSSIGGLGGCPYAPGATGNVATEAVVDLVNKRGYDTCLDSEKLKQVAIFAKGLCGK